jgi:integrase
MPTLNLTARGLKALAPQNNRLDYWDESLPGFGVRVTPDGRKTFCVMYRHAGRKRRHTLGTHPPLSLADARDLARAALRDVALGNDPASAKAVERNPQTFAYLATEYLERHAKPKKKSWREDVRIIRHSLLPAFGSVSAREITRRDVRAFLDRLAERAPIMANRTRALLRKIFNWGILAEIIETNPVHLVPMPARERTRERVLSEDEIRQVWKALNDQREGDRAHRRKRLISAASLKMRLLTVQRGGEVMGMEWSELDLENGWWTIPSARTKNGQSHRVPLNALALRIVSDLRELMRADPSRYVFASPKSDTHIENVQKALQRIRKATRIEFRGHDLRRTGSTMMTAMGIPRETVRKILNHKEPGVTAIYDRYSYDKEKREALEAWSRRLQIIVSGLREVGADSATTPPSARK